MSLAVAEECCSPCCKCFSGEMEPLLGCAGYFLRLTFVYRHFSCVIFLIYKHVIVITHSFCVIFARLAPAFSVQTCGSALPFAVEAVTEHKQGSLSGAKVFLNEGVLFFLGFSHLHCSFSICSCLKSSRWSCRPLAGLHPWAAL